MSSGTQIITDALELIGASSVVQPAPAESITKGMRRLNGMLQAWESDNIVLGVVPLETPGQELSEPMDATNAITDNLAIELASLFNSVVPPSLLKSGAAGMTHIKKHYQTVTIPKKEVSSTMPMGAGNMRGVDRDPFIGPSKTVAN